MGKGKTWIVVVGTAAILEQLKLLVATCWTSVRSLEQPWVLAFNLTVLDMALERLISLAWVVVVFYWLLRAHRTGEVRA